MTATTTTATVETDVRGHFAPIVERIAGHDDVPDGLAAAVMADTLKFVTLAATSAQPVVPTRLIDVGWHEFILHTRDYTEFCAKIGGYVHHVPIRGASTGNGDVYEATRRLLTERHGPLDPRLWPDLGADCGDCKAGECEAGKCTADCKS